MNVKPTYHTLSGKKSLEIESAHFPNFEEKYPLESDQGLFLARVLYSTKTNVPFPSNYDVSNAGIPIEVLMSKDTIRSCASGYRSGIKVQSQADMAATIQPQLMEIQEWMIQVDYTPPRDPLIEEHEIEDYYERFNLWIQSNPGLIPYKGEVLYLFSKMILAFHMPQLIDDFRLSRAERLKDVLKAIQTLNAHGVLEEDAVYGNRDLWLDAAKELQLEIRFRYQKDKFGRYQPALTNLARLLQAAMKRNRNRALYSLFDEFGDLENLFSEIYKEHKPIAKSQILSQLSRNIYDMCQLENSYIFYRYQNG